MKTLAEDTHPEAERVLIDLPRQTLDADLIARLLGQHAEPLTTRLRPEFYTDLPAVQAAIQAQGCFNLIHLETMTKVDVFVRWRDPFAQSQFKRRPAVWFERAATAVTLARHHGQSPRPAQGRFCSRSKARA